MQWAGRVAGFAFCIGTIAACSGSTSLASCRTDGDCRAGSRCEKGACARPSDQANDGGAVDASAGTGGRPGSAGNTGNSGGANRATGGSAATGAGGLGNGAGGIDQGEGGSVVVPGAGGVLPIGGAPSNRPDPKDFGHVDAGMDFTNPVTLPPPDTTFSGDAASLVGSWIELNFDGKPCTVQNSGTDLAGSVCTHLEVRATNGGYAGTLYREVSAVNKPQLEGPFAPPKDPSKGYPVELTPGEYGWARDFTPSVDYRIFDGLVRGGVFSFWISPLDLWSEWCGMQDPYLWNVAGKRRYRSVSQDPTDANTDLGKLALCTSAEDLPVCKDANDLEQPCVCLDDMKQFNFTLPQCSLTYCECSPTECHADLRGTAINGFLSVDGDTMTGSITFDSTSRIPITLQRVKP